MFQAILGILSVLSRLPSIVYRLANIFGGWFSFSRVTGYIVSIASFGFFTIALPLAIEWGLFNILVATSPSIQSNFSLSPTIIQLSGCGAWLADCFQLPYIVSIHLSFAFLSLQLRLMSGRPLLRY